MSKKIELSASEADCGVRIDKFIADNLEELTRSSIQNLIKTGDVLVKGTTVNKSYKLQSGDNIEVMIHEPQPLDAVLENIPIDIVYEDEDLLIVNKPKGMVVHRHMEITAEHLSMPCFIIAEAVCQA